MITFNLPVTQGMIVLFIILYDQPVTMRIPDNCVTNIPTLLVKFWIVME